MNRLTDPQIEAMLAKLQEINIAYYEAEGRIDQIVLNDYANQKMFQDAYREMRLCLLNLLNASAVDNMIKNTSEAA